VCVALQTELFGQFLAAVSFWAAFLMLNYYVQQRTSISDVVEVTFTFSPTFSLCRRDLLVFEGAGGGGGGGGGGGWWDLKADIVLTGIGRADERYIKRTITSHLKMEIFLVR
jgi:hypothetical protein